MGPFFSLNGLTCFFFNFFDPFQICFQHSRLQIFQFWVISEKATFKLKSIDKLGKVRVPSKQDNVPVGVQTINLSL